LLDLLVIYGYYSEDGLITYQLNHKGKGLIKIETILLLKPPYDLSSLILKDFTHSATLNFKHLFPSKRLTVKRAFLLNLCAILDQ
jgi:hypothetical protein